MRTSGFSRSSGGQFNINLTARSCSALTSERFLYENDDGIDMSIMCHSKFQRINKEKVMLNRTVGNYDLGFCCVKSKSKDTR